MFRGGSRKRLVVVLAVALLAVAGCTTGGSETTTQSTTTTPPNATDEVVFPDPPDSLSADRASAVATQYHLALMAQRLAGTGAGDDPTLPPRTMVETTVINRSEGGYYAAVELPDGAQSERAPRYSRAMYLLTEGSNPRSSYPIRVESVETYRDGAREASPLDLRVVNFDRSMVDISVVLTHLGGSPETAYVGAADLDAGTGLELAGVVGASGSYRVTVTTGETSSTRTIEYTGSDSERPVSVYVDPDGTVGIYRGPS